MQELQFIYHSFSSFLSSDIAQELFYKTKKFSHHKELQENITLSKEVYSYCEEFQSFSFLNIPTIQSSIEFTQKDYILDLKDIYFSYKALQQWEQLTLLDIPKEEHPHFHHIIHEIIFPVSLLPHWQYAFTQDGEITDNASPELKKIRSMKKKLRLQIEKILNNKLQNDEDLAEKRIAFREDRYVLPIKSVAKNRREGIVHGFSNSGTITYIEPPEIITLNNELLSVDDLEQQEIYRLLKKWSQIIAEYASDIILIINRTSQIEILFAKYHFAKKYSSHFAHINTNQEIILEEVYNPFLLLKKGKEKVIPISLELEKENYGIIISGPNAGGKSAALKTVALCVEMFLIGLPIPARTGEFPFFTDVLIEIGDSQDLDDDLSTFSGHLYNLKNILKKCSPSTLVLIDEIAHATDPIEGEALACAIIDELVKKQTFFIITTHYKQVKIKSFEHTNIKTYAPGFDLKKLLPLFTLYPNSIGESYALNIATRVGLAPHIVKEATDLINHKKDKTEQILANIEKYERNLRQKESALKQLQNKIEIDKKQVQSQKDQLNHRIEQLQKEGLAKADKEISFLLRELSSIQKQLKDKPKEATKKISTVQNIINKKKSEITELSRPKKTHIHVGETVFITSLNKNAIVEVIQKNTITVRTGNIKLSVQKSDVFEALSDNNYQKKIHTSKQYTQDIVHSVDVHGLTKEEALAKIDKYIYIAMVAGLNEFTIIHGKGHGILQKAVHQYLKNIPEIKKYSFAPPQEGGAGKTIVYFI